MDNTNNSENLQRRVADRVPAETIDWSAPGAPAVPLVPAATERANLPIQHVASLLVNSEGVSVFATPDAARLPHGHYMLTAAPVPPVPAPAPQAQQEGACLNCTCADGENCPAYEPQAAPAEPMGVRATVDALIVKHLAAPAVPVNAAPSDDEQWIFDLAAEYETRRNGLRGPVTFSAQGLANFAYSILARQA